jgi:hypothetical protein
LVKQPVFPTNHKRFDASLYGLDSDWAEQYVDSRLTGFKAGGDDYTRIKLPNAYNFDVTALDPDVTDVFGIHAHGWPVTLYKYSVNDPDGYGFGFNLSKAYGTNPSSHGNRPKGKGCIAVNNLVCSEEPQLAAQFSRVIVIGDWLNLPAIIVNASTSVTGTANLIGTTILKLINGSSVWITVPFDLADNVNFISFDYTFQQTAEGLLSVFFDDQLVYRADQRLDETGTVYHSGDVPIGDTTGGKHSLSFRLDAYNSTKSEIDISNVQLGNKQTVTECLFNWAERNYPALFAPSKSPTVISGVYNYRYYSATNTYLKVSSIDNHIYYTGADGILQDVGPLSDWLPKAGCQSPPPIDCLFNWAENNYPGLFAPSGSPTAIWDVYTYRHYSATNAYVGVSSADNHVYYMGADGRLLDEGALSYWLPLASCQ